MRRAFTKGPTGGALIFHSLSTSSSWLISEVKSPDESITIDGTRKFMTREPTTSFYLCCSRPVAPGRIFQVLGESDRRIPYTSSLYRERQVALSEHLKIERFMDTLKYRLSFKYFYSLTMKLALTKIRKSPKIEEVNTVFSEKPSILGLSYQTTFLIPLCLAPISLPFPCHANQQRSILFKL